MLNYIENPELEFKAYSVSQKRFLDWIELSNMPECGDILAGRVDDFKAIYQATDIEIEGVRVFYGDVVEFIDKGLVLFGEVKQAFGEVAVEFEDGDNYSYYRLDEVMYNLAGEHQSIEEYVDGGFAYEQDY